MSPNSSNFRGLMGVDASTRITGKRRASSATYVAIRFIISLNPISNKNIRVALLHRVAIRSKHQLLAVRREHWKTVERVAESDALQAGAVNIHFVEIEIAPLRVIHIRREYDALAVRKEVRRK